MRRTFFVRLSGAGGLVVDCRPADRVDARSAAPFAAMGRACEAAGWECRLVDEIDPVPIVNLRWLAGYRHSRYNGGPAMSAAVYSAYWNPAPLWRRPPRPVTRWRCCRWCSGGFDDRDGAVPDVARGSTRSATVTTAAPAGLSAYRHLPLTKSRTRSVVALSTDRDAHVSRSRGTGGGPPSGEARDSPPTSSWEATP